LDTDGDGVSQRETLPAIKTPTAAAAAAQPLNEDIELYNKIKKPLH
jgi:hypothetical protein